MQDRCKLLHTSKLRLFSQKENRPLTGRGRAWRTWRTRVSGGDVPLGEPGVTSRELLRHELKARGEELGQLGFGVGVEVDRREAEVDALCLGALVETHSVPSRLQATLDPVVGPVVGFQGGAELVDQLQLEGEPFDRLELGHDLLFARGRGAPAHQELEEPAHLLDLIPERGVDSPHGPDARHVRRRATLERRKRDLLAPVQVGVARVERESEDVAPELALEGERAIITGRRRKGVDHLDPEGLQLRVTRLAHLPEVGEEQVARPVPTVPAPHVQAESPKELGGTERHGITRIDSGFRRERVDEPLADVGEVELPKDRIALHELVELEGAPHGLKVTALSAVIPDEDVRLRDPQEASGVLAGLDRVGLAQDRDVRDDARVISDRPGVTGFPDLEPVLDEEDEHLIVAGEGHATKLIATQDVAQFPAVDLCNEARVRRLVHLDRVLDDLDGLGGPVELDHLGGRSLHHGLVAGQHCHHGGGLVAPLVEELLGTAVGGGHVTELGVDLRRRPLLVDHLEALGLFDGLGDVGVGGGLVIERRPGGAPDIGVADVGIRTVATDAELTGVAPHVAGVDGRSILFDRDRDLSAPRRDVTFVHEGLVDPGSARSRSGRLDRDFLSDLAVTRGLTADQGRQQEKEQVLHVSPRGRNVSHRAFSPI